MRLQNIILSICLTMILPFTGGAQEQPNSVVQTTSAAPTPTPNSNPTSIPAPMNANVNTEGLISLDFQRCRH